MDDFLLLAVEHLIFGLKKIFFENLINYSRLGNVLQRNNINCSRFCDIFHDILSIFKC